MRADLIFLIQVLVILVLPVAAWRVLRLRPVMPLVVVQILVGIALGPTLLGRVAPEFYRLFFNSATLTPLSGVASLAVTLFGFITGLHLDPQTFSGRGRSFAVVASGSVIVPTVAGFLAGLWIAVRHPAELGEWVGLAAFAMAIGVSCGVTALPVLGAILREMNLMGRRIGDLALGIAAINDVALWMFLALLIASLAGEAPDSPGVLVILLGLPVYLVMVRAVRPWLKRIATTLLTDGRLTERALAAACAVAFGSAIMTQTIGLHYIFGAFMAGALMPDELRRPILDRLEVVVIGLLMPFFFILTGLRTLIDFNSAGFLEIFVVTTALAVFGKIGGTALAARLMGDPWPIALGLGGLVQTKGLMELIVLTILLERGIISANMFSALILMAVVSTMLAMPVTRLVLRQKGRVTTVGTQPGALCRRQPKRPSNMRGLE